MEYDKAAKHLTEEIIHEFRLPTHQCYAFIHMRICMAIGIGFDIGRSATHHGNCKSVASVGRHGHIVKIYPTMTAAARDVDGDTSHIHQAIIGKRKTCKGYSWKYVDVKGLGTFFHKKPPVNS
jgi:hypothetical protein